MNTQCTNVKKLNCILRDLENDVTDLQKNKVNINSGKLVNPRIKGTLTMNGNIIPKHTEQYDLGSDENKEDDVIDADYEEVDDDKKASGQ